MCLGCLVELLPGTPLDNGTSWAFSRGDRAMADIIEATDCECGTRFGFVSANQVWLSQGYERAPLGLRLWQTRQAT
jgi:hypothetical protein